jgi:hypothetical protein
VLFVDHVGVDGVLQVLWAQLRAVYWARGRQHRGHRIRVRVRVRVRARPRGGRGLPHLHSQCGALCPADADMRAAVHPGQGALRHRAHRGKGAAAEAAGSPIVYPDAGSVLLSLHSMLWRCVMGGYRFAHTILYLAY